MPALFPDIVVWTGPALENYHVHTCVASCAIAYVQKNLLLANC